MPKRLIALITLLPWLLCGQALAQDGQRLAQEAAKAHLQGKLEPALGLLNEALRDAKLSNDRRAIILNDRGALLARLNRPKDAITDFNRAVQLYPEYPGVYNNRGSTLLTIGLPREAIKDFNRAVMLAPGYVAAFNNRAGAFVALGRYPQAIADYTTAINLTPNAVAALSGRGRVHLASDRPQAALRDFSRVLQIDARFALGYRNRAKARVLADDNPEAIEDLSRAIAFEPANPLIYLERGNAYLTSGDTASAIKDFSKALEIAPRNAPALEARALAHVRLSAHAEAEADIARALEFAPRSGPTYAARALLYLHTNQAALAASEISRAVKLAPKQAEVLVVRAEIEEAAGKRKAAIASYRAALAAHPTLKHAAAALERLGASAPPATNAQLDGLAINGWRVVPRGRHLVAVSPDFPRISVPLEANGQGLPRLLTFEVRPRPHNKFALLRFSNGRMQTSSGPVEAESVAIIDIAKSVVLGIIPDRRGAERSKWNWSDTKLVVASVDGLSDEFTLKASSPPATASRRRNRRSAGANDGPDWVPWQTLPAPRKRSRRSASSRRRNKPKTLFDILFGN